jgi:ADP-heptose:LPS heptosyltransferase
VGLEPPPVSRAVTDRLLRELSSRRFDRALVLVSYHQSPLPVALLLKLAGVGWIAADSEDYPGALLDLRHHRLPHRHEALAALDLARDAGFALPPGDDGALRVEPPPDTAYLTGREPYVVLHPGAAVPARAWSPDRAARAAAALSAAGHRVVVTGGRGERSLTSYVAGGHALDLGGATDLRQLAGMLAGARVVVVGNTGPTHLAATVGTPVVCLFAPVVPAERWGPYGVPHILLGDQKAACAGSRARRCPLAGHPCLDGIGDGQVLTAVDALCGPSDRATDRGTRPDARMTAAGAPHGAGRRPATEQGATERGAVEQGATERGATV